MNFNKLNNLIGWLVFLVAATTYILTAEAGGSFWDCGEFVSTAYKLQIPHPPGAPLFVLIGRFFIILFGDNPLNAAKAINIMNALASAFTVLFLFWTITHFARRLVVGNKPIAEITVNKTWTIVAVGIVGALAYTFSDSFWYSAVEGEVYALSQFFTAIVVWAILRWEHKADEPSADRWIVFIFFLIGLAIGVHLLNLLTIPAIVLVIFFRKRKEFNYVLIRKWFIKLICLFAIVGFVGALLFAPAVSYREGGEGIGTDSTLAGLVLFLAGVALGLFFLIEKKYPSKKELYGGAYIFFLLSVVILGIAQVGLIQYTIKGAGAFDRLFVNSFGLPFFSGFAFFFIILAVALFMGIRFANKKGYKYFALALWSTVFVLIGYSSYMTTLIRSSANPSVDMFNVDNPQSLVGYLSREQYGETPLLYGQKFTAGRPTYVDVAESYQKSTALDAEAKPAYIEVGKKQKAMYNKDDKMIFPRVWNNSNDRRQQDFYADFLGIAKYQDPQTGEQKFEREPNFLDNIRFFIGYQNYYMFMRYFLWNYSGRQNDTQGSGPGDIRGGNWITGISFIDNLMYGDQSLLPDSMKHNKAKNTFFALPLLLGLLGMFYHFKHKAGDALIVFLLFFMTGFAIIIYLNQAGNEPRERDYAFAGATYAFAIWIGIGLLKVKEWFEKLMNPKLATSVAFAACLLAVPVLMAQQGWDDHDRSKKELAPALAINYLESCESNAILFCYGDNDTYPLWYAQEVLGIRRDIRVVNTSLLGMDWYINGLRTKVNDSDPIDVIFSKAQIAGETRNVVYYQKNIDYPEEQYHDLYKVLTTIVASDNPNDMLVAYDGSRYNYFPTKKFSLPVNVEEVRKNKLVEDKDSVVTSVEFEYPKSYIAKNDLAELSIIAANNWKRPIYFTADPRQIGLGLDKYIRKEGMAYKLVPVMAKSNDFVNINLDKSKKIILEKFKSGNADRNDVYFDEENRRHLIAIRTAYAELALKLATENRIQDAKQILAKADKAISQESLPYGAVYTNNMNNATSMMMLQATFICKDKPLFDKIAQSVKKDCLQQIKYVEAMGERVGPYVAYEAQRAQEFVSIIDAFEKEMQQPTSSTEPTKN